MAAGDAFWGGEDTAIIRQRRDCIADRVLFAGVFLLSLLLYIRTLAPSVVTVFDDSPEFQLVCYLLGVAHPTGYPLYTLIGKLFTIFPFGDVAYRVNLMSAVFGAGTVAMLVILLREVTGSRAAGIVAAAALAVSPVFWGEATIAEVYTLHTFFLTLCLWLLARWERSGPASRRWLLLLATVFGLALTHHRMIGLLVPGGLLVIYLTWRQGVVHQEGSARSLTLPSTWPRWPTLLLVLLLPLLIYLYIPLVGAQVGSLDGRYTNTLSGFLRHVLALDYGVFLFGNPFDKTRDVSFYLNLLRDQFGVVGAWVGLLGLLLPWKRRRIWLGVLCTMLICLIFALFYSVADIEVFLLPVFLVWVLGIGAALSKIEDAVRVIGRRVGLGLGEPLSVVLVLLFCVQPISLAVTGWASADRSRSWEVHDAGVDFLSQPLPNEATIIGILGEMTVLRYFQQTQGLRTDVRTVAANLESERWDALGRVIGESGEAYLTRELPGSAVRYKKDAFGPLIRVRPIPAEAEAARCSGEMVLPGMCLLETHAEVRETHTRTAVRLTLLWLASQHIDQDVRISARLHSSDGWVVAQHDSRPVHETYPTAFWSVGETVTDVLDLWVAPGTPAGQFQLVLILYDPRDGQELTRSDLGQVSLPWVGGRPRASDLQVAEGALLALGIEKRLLGYSLFGEAFSPGDSVVVETLWAYRQPVAEGTEIRLSLVGQGDTWAETSLPLQQPPGGDGEILARQRNALPLPANIPDGEYVIRLGMMRQGNLQRWGPAWLPWLPISRWIPLGEIRVVGRERSFDMPLIANPVEAHFASSARLVGWEIRPAIIARGERVDVRLVWQALEPMGESYSVFVHLVGTNQAGEDIVAQHDSPPGLGALPTSSWVTAEVIEDLHPLEIPSDVPAGTYLIQAGLYDPSSGLRLPVEGAGPGVEADRVILGHFLVE